MNFPLLVRFKHHPATLTYSDDDENFLGFKNNDFEGMVKIEDYDTYMANFSFKCYDNGEFKSCK